MCKELINDFCNMIKTTTLSWSLEVSWQVHDYFSQMQGIGCNFKGSSICI